ncbi:hypothetical protein TrVE_jg11739 [Triparma verrucosa]|uniref:Uncharacterized protein n=1 Tax=Triparma verrucosa TaxID=1606542 RepID=A0A9W7CKS1_9STRA|nr:hypothetical protein TrVE_jg11739 [Triparma verrucosa]
MLSADHHALVASQQQGMNSIRMKEIELFSSQLGHVAAVGSFLSANAFLGIIQGMDYNEDVEQRFLVYTYFISAGIGFGSCMTAAVCSTFVMIWGTQKAFRGKKEEISKSVVKMYAYRRSMVRMLIVGVLTNMLMAAVAQFAKSGDRGEDGFKVVLAIISIFFMGYVVYFCRKVHGEFKMDKKYNWEIEAFKSLGVPETMGTYYQAKAPLVQDHMV